MARTRGVAESNAIRLQRSVLLQLIAFTYILKARAQTYSSYKHHNTVKLLIGIAPQGALHLQRKDGYMTSW